MSTFIPGLYLAVLLFAIIMIVGIFRDTDNRKSGIYLGLLIAFIGLGIWNQTLSYASDIGNLHFLQMLQLQIPGLGFCWAPLLYIYIQDNTGTSQSFIGNIKKHAAFPSLMLMVSIALELMPKGLNTILVQTVNLFYLLIFYSFTLFYFAKCVKCLKHYQSHIENSWANLEQLTLDWLRQLVLIFACFITLDFVLSVLLQSGGIQHSVLVDITILMQCLSISLIGYYRQKQPQRMLALLTNKTKETSVSSKAKYANSAIDEKMAQQIAPQMKKEVKDKELFRNNQLTLAELAAATGLSPNHLSQVINGQLHCNFYEFVNRMRIDYAVEKIEMGDYQSFTQLAFDAGFNNRISFTNAFKKFRSVTPSVYKTSLKN